MNTQTKTNVFISYSFDASREIKEEMAKRLSDASYAVDFSEKHDISDESDEVIWNYLKNRISGSSVMIIIYSRDFERNRGGKAFSVKDSEIYSYGKTPFKKQGWIYREIRCALREEKDNALNGIIVVMPDDIYNQLYSSSSCAKTGTRTVNLNREIYPPILKENYNNKKQGKNTTQCGCCFNIVDDSYIPVVKLSTFNSNMKYYIELAKEKRNHAGDYNIVKEI